MEGKRTGVGYKMTSAIFEAIQLISDHPRTRYVAECAVRGILGFIISRAVIFGEYSPFGIGYAVAAGGTIPGLIGVLGTIFGYASLWGTADGLKYIAGVVLAYATTYIFKGINLRRYRYFEPAAAAAAAFFVGFVFVIERGLKVQVLVLFLTELILVFASAYFYREIFGKTGVRRGQKKDVEVVKTVSVFILMATLLISLSEIKLAAGISVSRLAAIIFVMAASYRGNVGVGGAAGVSMGIAFDVSGGGGFYSMTYGFAGLVASVTGRNRRLQTAVAFVITSAAVTLVDIGGGINLVSLFEVFAGSVIFMILPDRFMPDMHYFEMGVATQSGNSDKLSRLIKDKMDGTARAFAELSEAVKTTIDTPGERNYKDISKVFDRAADKVCRSCALKGLCWDRDSISTYNIMNDLTLKLVKEGKLEKGDLPKEFASRCLKPDAFIMAVNSEMRSSLVLRRYRSRLSTSRNIVGGQYSEVAAILRGVAEEVTGGIEEDLDIARQIERLLADTAETSVLVWRGSSGRIRIDITGRDLSKIRKPLTGAMREISRTLDRHFSLPEFISDATGYRVRINESELYNVKIGVATYKKRGSSISGDCGTYFKTDEGRLYVILSDGMGSGRDAAVESGTVVRLMEKFLRAGVEIEAALSTVNSALMLKNLEEGTFATVDILEIDLFDGRCRVYKYGAAPTFVRKGKRIRTISGRPYPPGTGIAGTPVEPYRSNLGGGELITMMSDGAYDPIGDTKLRGLIDQYGRGNPKELAFNIAGEAYSKSGDRDDISTVVIEVDVNRQV